ncbi:MAG: ABC transporter substrate-binding protein [Eubacteriales bacterium]
MLELKKVLSVFLIATMVAILFAFGGCSGSNQGKPVLKVYNWGDYIDEEVISLFEEETGIDVIYDTFETNESMYTKIKTTGASTYDVVIPSDYMIKRMADEGLLAEIDVSELENYHLIDEEFKGLEYDPDNKYSVPYMWGTVGILYNTKMVDDPVDSWTILWNEKYSRKIFMMDSVRDSIGITLKMLGYSLNSTDLEQLKEAEQKLIEQRPLVLAYTADEVKDKMIAGEAAMAVVYSGDAITCMDPDYGNPDLAYAVPKEGSNLWFDAMCILEGSPNKEAAMKFIDFMCRTDIAAKNRDFINYSTPQREVYESLPDEIKNDPVQYPPQEVLDSSEVFADLGESIAYYEDLWVRVTAG